MKNAQVIIGHVYIATVSGRRVAVKIWYKCGTEKHYTPIYRKHDGWIALNLKTGRTIYITSGRRLQKDITDNKLLIKVLSK